MTEEKRILLHPISEALAKVYNQLYEIKEVKFPLYDTHLKNIDTVVKNVEAIYYGKELYPTPQVKAAAYFCFIIKDHPFTDGNKRMAVLWLDILCEVYDITMTLPKSMTLDVLAVSVEAEKQFSIRELIMLVRTILF